MKKILLIFVIAASGLYAQNEDDALRYSVNYFGGTARNMSTAGALTAMGGDFSNASQNPAGLGRLKKSNFSFTQNVEIPSITSDFYGSSTTQTKLAYNFSNISYVKAYELDPTDFNNWYGVQIGIGMNRIKSFNETISYSGLADSSLLHSFIGEANGTSDAYIYDYFPFTAGLAYDVFAIDPDTSNSYTTAFNSGKAKHNREVTRKGGMSEFSLLTFSGNYKNKLLLGGSLNLIHINYLETLTHAESYEDEALWLDSINYTGSLEIKGNGGNLRIGAIYMPLEQIRIGLSLETPTLYFMKDSWTNNMTSETSAGSKFVDSEYVPIGSYEYKVRTPFKANLSFAGVIKKLGSIGAEIEYVDYGNAKLSDRNFTTAPYSFNNENTQIDNIFRSVFNYKIGLEARINKQIYARAGFAYYTTSFKSTSGNNLNPTTFITAGLGYNFGQVYLDFAYLIQSRNEDYYAYDPTINGSLAKLNVNSSQIVLSFGVRF
jgi:hypothetical protein